MNIFHDFLSILIKVAIICLLIGIGLGFWLAQKGLAETSLPDAMNTVQRHGSPAPGALAESAPSWEHPYAHLTCGPFAARPNESARVYEKSDSRY